MWHGPAASTSGGDGAEWRARDGNVGKVLVVA